MKTRSRILLPILAVAALCCSFIASGAVAAEQRPRYGGSAKKPSAAVENANRKYRDKAVQPASAAQPAKSATGKAASAKGNPAASRRYLATNRADYRKSQPAIKPGAAK